MKKFLIAVAALALCFLFTSFGLSVVYPFKSQEETVIQPDENTQKIYSIIDAANNYNTEITKSDTQAINELASILSSNMIVRYDEVAESVNINPESPTITAYFIDWERIALNNNTVFDFSLYNEYIPQLSYDAMEQIYSIANNENLYTREYIINIEFKSNLYSDNPKAILSSDDMSNISDECYAAAQNIYEKYLNASEISTAFFCKSIKELPLDNIVDVYNASYPDNQIEQEWQKQLFTSYSEHYIDNLVIENIINASAEDQVSKCTINYQIENGSITIDKTLTSLLEHYYQIKQPPIEREQVIDDFSTQLGLYNYTDESALNTKSFDFTYTQDFYEFTIDDDFYTEIVGDIYEEFALFDDIFNEYYPLIEGLYFYEPRPFNGTTVIIDNTGDTRYRQLDIVVSGDTDCYIKLYSYDTVNDILINTVFAAYIKTGESLQIFIPEGDYVFKYATGQTWYGDVYKFSDEGQYYMSSDVISVHEYMMTTKIELGNFASGSIPVNSQTPDLF